MTKKYLLTMLLLIAMVPSCDNTNTTTVAQKNTATIITADVGVAPAYPQIAADARGNSFVVWLQASGLHDTIGSVRRNAATGWGTASPIMPDNVGSAGGHAIAANARGDAMAVWDLYDGVCYHIWANKYTAGSGWEGALAVENSASFDAIEPGVAIDPNGNAVVVWRQTDGTSYKTWVNLYQADTGWGTAQLLDTDAGGFDFSPQVAIDASGNAIVVWLRQDGPDYSIKARRYVAGSGWEAAISTLSTKLGYSEYPRIAVDGSGNMFVVWNQVDIYPVISTWCCRYAVGTGWEAPQVIETDDSGYTYRAQIAVTPGGDAFAAWEQGDGTRYNIAANHYIKGTGWGTAEIISSSDGTGTQWPALGVDAEGNAVAAWQQINGGSSKIFAASYSAEQGWSAEHALQSDNAPMAVYPVIAMDKGGYAIAAWEQYENNSVSNNVVSIWANRFRY
jgi:hypothetical protein